MSERGEYNCYDKWCAQVDHVSSVRAVKQVRRAHARKCWFGPFEFCVGFFPTCFSLNAFVATKRNKHQSRIQRIILSLENI